MVGYLEAVSVMHTRGVSIDEKDYIFTLMIVLDEEPANAFAFAYDKEEFKKNIGTEEEGTYISSKKEQADIMLGQQNIVQLKSLLEDSYRAQVQATALNLQDFKFSGQETVQILNNLLKTRIDDLESSSVKDVVSLLKALSEQGALEMGDGGFSKHFIQIFPKFNALCVNCNKEFQAAEGIGVVCPNCGQLYKWEGTRFYPSYQKL